MGEELTEDMAEDEYQESIDRYKAFLEKKYYHDDFKQFFESIGDGKIRGRELKGILSRFLEVLIPHLQKQ